ncbi:stage VI sporulation protein D [Pueribacillus theae]|uniref:Stage VI sporulation protein D n=1 Tax=Pueribacillus theae TaxID=2171751 RepID=A0A2U1JZZ1_9BACI|nr:stage VI sporulation protein D [Pueribacillus theae]PWA10702.1 stage VI sporulation protein D [Pueribacillus theae]
MMDSLLHFTVEESVWFRKGEEIEDILSVSLEPEITVEEDGDYVFIKGELRLNGEFRILENNNDFDDSDNEQLSFRTVQDIRVQNDGTAEFNHRFPVEITIPVERVDQLDDVYVVVNSFDYHLPNEQCFQLTAELAISGIKGESTSKFNETKEIENDNRLEPFEKMKELYLSDKSSFEINIKEQDVEMEREEENETNDNLEKREVLEQTPQIELKGRTEEEEKETYKQFDQAYQNDNDALLSLSNAADRASEDKDIDIPMDFHEDQEEAEGIDDVVNREEEIVTSEEEIEEEETAKKEPRNENALYLTKMLTRDGEEFSKLRMRIIQPGDSLDSIAEVYELQPSQIARVNRLEREEVEEGQILYIPVKKAGK